MQEYFRKLLNPYLEALSKEDNIKDFSDLAKTDLNNNGVYAAMDYAGMGNKTGEFNDKLNESIEAEVQAVMGDSDAYQATLTEAAAQILHASYDATTQAFTDANGKEIENVDTDALVRAYIEGEGMGDIRNKSREILAEMGDPEALEKYDQYIETLKKVEEHQKRSEEKNAESVEAHGLDADTVKNLTDLI